MLVINNNKFDSSVARRSRRTYYVHTYILRYVRRPEMKLFLSEDDFIRALKESSSSFYLLGYE